MQWKPNCVWKQADDAVTANNCMCIKLTSFLVFNTCTPNMYSDWHCCCSKHVQVTRCHTKNLQVLYRYYATKAVFENRLMMQSRPATASSLLQVWKENTTNHSTHRKTSQERRVTGPWRAVSVLIGERITTVRKTMAEGAQYQASSQDTVPRICEKECIFSSFSCIIRPKSSMSIMLTVRYTRYTHLCPHQVSHFTSDS